MHETEPTVEEFSSFDRNQEWESDLEVSEDFLEEPIIGDTQPTKINDISEDLSLEKEEFVTASEVDFTIPKDTVSTDEPGPGADVMESVGSEPIGEIDPLEDAFSWLMGLTTEVEQEAKLQDTEEDAAPDDIQSDIENAADWAEGSEPDAAAEGQESESSEAEIFDDFSSENDMIEPGSLPQTPDISAIKQELLAGDEELRSEEENLSWLDNLTSGMAAAGGSKLDEESGNETPDNNLNVIAESSVDSTDLLPVELEKARQALREGDLADSMDLYGRLIAAGEELEAIAQDLEAAAEQFPDSSIVWQNLGDTYLRLERTHEASFSFGKAEQLRQ